MTASTIAIVGSGIVGTTVAYHLAHKGYDVEIFEKGPEYAYPHGAQFREKILYQYDNPAYTLPKDLKNLTCSGDYGRDLNSERVMVVGGTATVWQAVTLRMLPQDFKTRTLYGYGEDWPLAYDDLEPYYCKAEALLGVSGTDADNPFAPRRSSPYPLPAFELSYDDALFADRLRQHGIVLHTTPQARTRAAYGGRPACMNFGTCRVCPIGARYSPNYHLLRAIETGRCRVHTNTSVRRLVVDKAGRARALVYQANDEATEREHSANVIIVAAGALESARLLLLSTSERHPDGLGNDAGHVGKHLTFHHLWSGQLHYKNDLHPGRFGGYTGQTHQFLAPPNRGRHGGVVIQFSSQFVSNAVMFYDSLPEDLRTGSEVVEFLNAQRHWRPIVLQAESTPSPQKHVTLSEQRDRYGDRYAHVHYESTAFDHETYGFACELFDRFITATGADEAKFARNRKKGFTSGHHHMGTCRMGHGAPDSVVDQFGKLHGTPNLFVLGGSNFVSPSAVNPTLTMVALAIRTTDYIVDRLL
jgi:choline dehydrogenase-like flavoprotein